MLKEQFLVLIKLNYPEQRLPYLCAIGLYNRLLSGHNVGFLWLEAPSIRERPVAHFGSVRLESGSISDADALF